MADFSATEFVKRSLIQARKRSKTLLLSDTTLRDGEQMPGVRLVPQHKLAIARQLTRLGVQSIDAGFPACGPSETEAVRLITEEIAGPVISVLARAAEHDIDLAADALRRLPANKKSVSIFLATSPVHREHKLHKSRQDILRMVVDAVRHARRDFELVAFSPEDASRTEPDFLFEVYQKAIEAGATTVGFTDTVGVLTPEKAVAQIRAIKANVGNIGRALLGVHFHNDLGLATANALACVAEGVDAVQGTINGLGERAGNTALEEVVMAVALHPDQYPVDLAVDTRVLAPLSRLVARLTGVPVPANKAVVGPNIFATEAGIHQDGLIKHVDTYLPFHPEVIGREGIHLVLGKHSGRHMIAATLQRLGVELADGQFDRIFALFKQLCDCKRHVTDDDLLGIVDTVRSTKDEG